MTPAMTSRNDQDVTAEFGTRLRSLRDKKDISQERLAELAGVHWTTIGQIERGERGVKLVTLLRLAKGLGVDPAVLVKGMEPPDEPAVKTRPVKRGRPGR